MFDAAARICTVPKKNATAGIPGLIVIPRNVSTAAIIEAVSTQVTRKAALSDHFLANNVSRGLTSCFWRSTRCASFFVDFSSGYRRREYTTKDSAKSNASPNGVGMSSTGEPRPIYVSLGLLAGEAKVFRHGKAQTLYVTIPSTTIQDSAFTAKEGNVVEIKWDKGQSTS